MGRVPGGEGGWLMIWEVEEVRPWTQKTELPEVDVEFRGVQC